MSQNSTVTLPTNPYFDPKNDPCNPLRYIVSNSLTVMVISVVLASALIHTFWAFRYRTTWMLTLVTSEYCYAIGFCFRFLLHYYPDSRRIYITEYLIIVLSPCGFIAADYVLLGRFAKFLSCSEHVPLPPNKITLVFVISDISTFLIQATGGSLITSHSATMIVRGVHILLAGLVLQLVSFFTFSCIYVRFLYKIYTRRPDIWNKDQTKSWYSHWRALAGALMISSIGILIRSGYRVAEISYGYQGLLATTEGYFYFMDTLPLVIANLAYIPCWPARFIFDEPVQENTGPNLSSYSSTVAAPMLGTLHFSSLDSFA
ncbi:RTA1 like protein-domain-containing protein [Scleroderma yunnanense]